MFIYKILSQNDTFHSLSFCFFHFHFNDNTFLTYFGITGLNSPLNKISTSRKMTLDVPARARNNNLIS